jgi:hypothetical protein
MLRRFRVVAFAVLVSLAVGLTGCADLTGPSADCTGSQTSENCPR